MFHEEEHFSSSSKKKKERNIQRTSKRKNNLFTFLLAKIRATETNERKRGGSRKGKPLKFNFETIKKMTTDWKHFCLFLFTVLLRSVYLGRWRED